MIIATAGHVDHGKTRLVEALTGVDTDTLAEEKQRGLTITPGFAYLPVDGKLPVGFIDVPGHDRFIRNALCGLTAAQHVLLVVAADDGPSAQTLEHLSIVDLLEIGSGTVAITKTDRVSPSRITAVREQIEALLAETVLAGAPCFRVSSTTGDGVAALRDHLCKLAREESDRIGSRPDSTPDGHLFRLAVDRSFTVRGAGLVVTGTVAAGSVRAGDSVQVAGTDITARVRGLRIHDQSGEVAVSGQRCALNLAGPDVDKDRIVRGAWVTDPRVAAPVTRFDVALRLASQATRSFSHWTPVHLHHAASATTARIALLDCEELLPGQTTLAQVIARQPVGAVFGDRFIIRDQSARHTLGGGHVVDIAPPRRRRASPERLRWLAALNQPDARAALVGALAVSRNGVDLDQFLAHRNLAPAARQRIFKDIRMVVVEDDNRTIAFDPDMWRAHRRQLIDTAREWQAQSDRNRRLDRQTLTRTLAPSLDAGTVRIVLEALLATGELRQDNLGIRPVADADEVEEPDQQLWQQIVDHLEVTGIRPVRVADLSTRAGVEVGLLSALLARRSERRQVIRLPGNLVMLPTGLRHLVDHARALESQHGAISVAAFRDATGIGRNRSIEILEFLDARGITVRQGNDRHVRSTADRALGRLVG